MPSSPPPPPTDPTRADPAIADGAIADRAGARQGLVGRLATRLGLRLGQQLHQPAGRPGSVGARGSGVAASRNEPLLEMGRQLREARERRGLGLRQLAQETRISTAVLEALERGWRDRLPEAAYLRTMLPLLEQHLELPIGSLEAVLPPEQLRVPGAGQQPLLRRFTPGSIDVFTTWQGTLLYGLLTLALIAGVNQQQRRLADLGLLSSRPIPPLDPQRTKVAEALPEALLAAYPDLRPIERARGGQALGQLRQQSHHPRPDLSLGQLQLQLRVPTRVELRGRDGGVSQLESLQGQLTLPVLPPFELRLDPAPAAPAQAVLWNGRPLTVKAGEGGVFRYPPGPPPRP